mmetsp:Transcript_5347/g.7129  ORF Transcript_5347/g.7129 Transcript_5347/m.7129 type:complete len:82 (-) Transcript_5347:10-255(-)
MVQYDSQPVSNLILLLLPSINNEFISVSPSSSALYAPLLSLMTTLKQVSSTPVSLYNASFRHCGKSENQLDILDIQHIVPL